MGRIQSSVGLVSGIQIEDTVNQLMALNALPRDRLQSRTQQLQQEQVALTELVTQVVGVQLTTDRLGQASLFSATRVSSSKSDLISATSSGSPKPGTYSFTPVRQASSQQLTSSLFASGDQKLSVGEVVIHTGGFLDESVGLDELNGGAGVARGFIKITDRSGTSENIDLRFAQTASDVVDAINSNDSLKVVAKVDGDSFTLTDVSGATASNLEVAEVGSGTTASDLGLGSISVAGTSATGTGLRGITNNTSLRSLLDNRGLELPTDGASLRITTQDGSISDLEIDIDSNTSSVGELIEEVNDAADGKFEIRISDAGNSFEIVDLTIGSGTLTVSSPNGSLAEQLGFDNAAAGGVITGDQLLAGLNDTLLSSLAGGTAGSGLGDLGQVSITDRAGNSDTIDLSNAATLGDVIDTINASSANVTARLNRAKTGIEIVDSSGSTANDLIIANGDATNSATKLQIEVTDSVDSIDSGSLQRQYINRNSSINELNQGSAIALGTIRVTDSLGETADINLAGVRPETVGDVVDALNGLDLGIEARINDAGDGILIVDTAGGTSTLSIEDVGSGQAAKQLGIAGESDEVTVDGAAGKGIDGSTTVRIATTSSTTVSELATKINELSNSPINANLLNLNESGGVRLLLNSVSTGARGRVSIDSNVGVNFSETTAGQDALIAFGASETSGGVLVSSATNKFSGVIEDVELDVTGASDSPVSVTISENSENVSKQIDTFITQFNSLRDRLDTLTNFDEASNTVGLLFGSNSALRIDLAFGRLFSSSINGAGSIKSLGQVGIRLNESGKLTFDKSKFEQALAEDPSAVQEFFTTEETGFSAKAKAVADSLASVESGALLNKTNAIQTQIETNNSRISALNTRLDRQRDRLLLQFFNMEQAISKLQTNLSALDQLQVITPLT